MAGDAPFLERLAQMPPVAASETAALLERLEAPNTDPVIGPLFGADDEGETVVNPLVPVVLQNLVQKEGLTCYAALIEGLTIHRALDNEPHQASIVGTAIQRVTTTTPG